MAFRGGSLLPQRQTSVASMAASYFPEEPRPIASFCADPVDLHVLQATRYPAFLGDAVKLRSYWGHDAMPEVQGGAPSPPLPRSAAQGTVRTQ